MGKGLVPSGDLASFLLSANPQGDADFVKTLTGYYIQEADLEGVNHDIAFAQMCLETGFLKYGNLATPDMNNFCGLGSISEAEPGERFPNPQIGVRAQIQHLKGYASADPLVQDLVDPRFKWIPRGSAGTIHDLAGKWATDPDYGDKIAGILRRLYAFAFDR
jgi:hypothetical protein